MPLTKDQLVVGQKYRISGIGLTDATYHRKATLIGLEVEFLRHCGCGCYVKDLSGQLKGGGEFCFANVEFVHAWPPKSDEELMEEAWHGELDQMSDEVEHNQGDVEAWFKAGWQAAHRHFKGEPK